VEGYKKIEDGVVGGYKKIEETVVDSYKKVAVSSTCKTGTRDQVYTYIIPQKFT
jgi:hypothetical protein